MTQPQNGPDLLELSDAEHAAVKLATKRKAARVPRLTVTGQQGDSGLQVSPSHADQVGWMNRLLDAFGTTSTEFATRCVSQLADTFRVTRTPATVNDINAGLAAVDGLKPENEIEAMLAVQMAATHNIAMDLLSRAHHAETTNRADNYGNLAMKLLRTYTMQAEALAKLRRKGEQTVVVKHVHVYPGGQAIVGNVSRPGEGGGRPEIGRQPHGADPRALAVADGSPVWSEEPARQSLPAGGSEGPDAVQAPRGSKRERCPDRRAEWQLSSRAQDCRRDGDQGARAAPRS